MENIIVIMIVFVIGLVLGYITIKFLRYGFFLVLFLLVLGAVFLFYQLPLETFLRMVLYAVLPYLFIIILFYVFIGKEESSLRVDEKYQLILNTKWNKIILKNIRRGISIIGSAGSGKTESVVYNVFDHLGKYGFCGVMHDYKNFEITEMAYPIFKETENEFHSTQSIIRQTQLHQNTFPMRKVYTKFQECF